MAKADILLIEDQAADRSFLRRAIEKFKHEINLHIVSSGQDVLDFLYRRNEHMDAVRPSMILLDVSTPPKNNGSSILEIIKFDDKLRDIPVIIFSNSDEPSDISLSYKLYANGYLKKPKSFEEMERKLSSLFSFWLKHCRLPKGA